MGGGVGGENEPGKLQSMVGNRRSVPPVPTSSKKKEKKEFQKNVTHSNDLACARRELKKEWTKFEKDNPPLICKYGLRCFQFQLANSTYIAKIHDWSM